jgi:hypothetical protein
MSPAGDIVDLLQARASSGRNAFRIVDSLFTKIIADRRADEERHAAHRAARNVKKVRGAK